MTRALLFWMIFIIWILFSGFVLFGNDDVRIRTWVPTGNSLILVLLIGLLGWESYGPAIKG